MKTAIIVGSEGQDGQIIFDALLGKNYKVLGIGKKWVRSSGIVWDKAVDITESAQVENLLRSFHVDEIYYLAACHQSSEDMLKNSAELFRESYAINVLGLLNFLEGIKKHSPLTRLFYASSSLIYEGTSTAVQDEDTPFCPESIYGMTKLDGLLLCRFYRDLHGVFASVGILYNHESSFRRDNFISKKIINAAISIKQGRQEILAVGDLSSQVDWGYAPDYVEAMQKILNISKADDFIIASGEKHSVQDFIQAAFEFLSMDWKKYVREDASVMTRKRKVLVGNTSKLKKMTAWQPTVDFHGMIKLLVKADI